MRGFRDASKVGSAGAARKRMDEDYGGFGKDWHAGFVQGLRDAGMSGARANQLSNQSINLQLMPISIHLQA